MPSTGSDHVPILITLSSPDDNPSSKTPCWDQRDWEVLRPRLVRFRIPLAPARPSPAQLEEWFSSSLNSLMVTLLEVTPRSRPSPRSKPWWTPLLIALNKGYNKATRTMKKHTSENRIHPAKLSKLGYFKAIKWAKGLY